MNMEDCDFTIERYLRGKVRNISISDDALMSICADAGVTPGMPYVEADERQRDLSLAWLYVWVAGSPTQSGGFSEQDADWRSSADGERMSASVLKNYLAMANKIFEKYGLETISTNKWGFVGRGFHNIRKYS